MSVQLGQVALVAGIASVLKSKNAGAAVQALLSSGLVKIVPGQTITIPTPSTNGLKKFEPKIPNLNKAQRKKEKCIDLQMKINIKALELKLPVLNLAFTLPKLPTFNLDFLKNLLTKEIQCVLEALALIALIKSLMAGGSSSAAAAASAAVLAGAEANTEVAQTTPTSARSTTEIIFYNPSL